MNVAAFTIFMSILNVSSADCEFLHNNDQKNMCRAVANHNKTWCEFIRDHDLKIMCRARFNK